MRYALGSGGKRVRPVLCLAVADASRGAVERALPAATALELVHTFSLVHDDLPALDDDAERRGVPSTHVRYGDGVALLAGDALLAEAFRLALSYDDPTIARELADATVAMIGGQHRDIVGDDHDLAEVERLKTGRLFSASVGLALNAVGVPVGEQAHMAGVRRRARPALPGGGRHPGRGRLRGARRCPGSEAACGRRRGARPRAAGRDFRRHVGAAGARRGSRCSNHLRVDARPDTATIRRSRTGQVRAQPNFFARRPSFPPHRCPSAFTASYP